jgi:hypothetical protein
LRYRECELPLTTVIVMVVHSTGRQSEHYVVIWDGLEIKTRARYHFERINWQ